MNKLSIASFTNLGFRLHSREFEPITRDLSDHTAVVTGSTGGIGLEAARQLSGLGARVVVVGRSQEKLDRAANEVGARGLRADLSVMTEIRDFADELQRTEDVDILVNNVGVLLSEYSETPEGLETSFATNLAGHFLLTNLLLPGMIDRGGGRIVNVSSGGMYGARLRPDALQVGPDVYNGTKAYALAKRGQVVLTEMWAEAISGTGIKANAMHPGWVATQGVAFSLPTFNSLMKPLLRDVAQGADTIVWLAADADAGAHNGGFFFDRSRVDTHLSDSTVEDEADRVRFWDHLVEVTGADLELVSSD